MTESETKSVKELQEYIDGGIIPARAMRFKVERCCSSEVTLFAPLEFNSNDKGTCFAGSSASLATLACWALADRLSRDWAASSSSAVPSVVAKETSIRYRRPISSDFSSTCISPSPEIVRDFMDLLSKQGKASIELESTVISKVSPSESCVIFRGVFVAIARH